MSVLIAILLIIVILIVFLLFLALVTKKEYTVTRDIVINYPKQQVFDYAKLIKNQEQYNVWVMADPAVKIDYKGTDGTEGFVSAWQGNKQVGKGEQEIKAIDNGNSINIELRFEKPFKNVGHATMVTTAVGEDKTNIKWTMEGKNKFPMNLLNLVIDGLLGKDLGKSLANLKQILEAKK